MMNEQQKELLIGLIEQYDGVVVLLPPAGGRLTLTRLGDDYIVFRDPGHRRHRQTLFRGGDLDDALAALKEEVQG